MCIPSAHIPLARNLFNGLIHAARETGKCSLLQSHSMINILHCPLSAGEEAKGRLMKGDSRSRGPLGGLEQTLTPDFVSLLLQASLHLASVSLPSSMPRPRSGCPQTTF